jgi:hypothetical protein
MLKKIEALRKQPIEVRNRYAFWIAASVTLVIAVIWGSTLPARFSEEEPVATETTEPSSSMMDSIKRLFVGIGEQFGPVIVTPNGATTTEERIDLVELLKNATTTPEQKPLPPSPQATTSTTTSVEISTTSTTTSSTSLSN